MTGFTGSTNFPTQNPFQSLLGGSADVFVTKLNPDGSALVYSSYLGGAGEDVANAIAVDASSNAYVTGHVLRFGLVQPNFPTMNPFQALHAGGNWDAFLTKLNPAGSGLLYSTYLGGVGRDRAFGVAVDPVAVVADSQAAHRFGALLSWSNRRSNVSRKSLLLISRSSFRRRSR